MSVCVSLCLHPSAPDHCSNPATPRKIVELQRMDFSARLKIQKKKKKKKDLATLSSRHRKTLIETQKDTESKSAMNGYMSRFRELKTRRDTLIM